MSRVSEPVFEEFLVYQPELPFSWQEMIEQKLILTPQGVLGYLKEAQEKLRDTPGPNQEQRQELEPEWIGWWVEFFEKYGDDLDPNRARAKFLTPDEIAEQNVVRNQKGIPTGNTIANGFEGHPGQRSAAEHIVSAFEAGFVGLLLDEKITPGKPRSAHYLPLELRMCMWAYYVIVLDAERGGARKEFDYIGVIPTPRVPILTSEAINDFYDEVFFASRTMMFFFMEGDPHAFEKSHRSVFSATPSVGELLGHFEVGNANGVATSPVMFSLFSTARTTDRTRRLQPDKELPTDLSNL